MEKNNIITFVSILLIVLISVLTLAIRPREINNRDLTNNNTTNNTVNNNSLDTSYLSISDVTLTSNSSYTICTGTISVKSYSPYKYHYIKVKGAFQTSYGTTVDTDWTYGIGTEWLEPGESTKFRLSVDKDSTIRKCIVTIME